LTIDKCDVHGTTMVL